MFTSPLIRCLCRTVYLCGPNVTRIRTRGALNERVLSKKPIIQVLGLRKKSGSDVQGHEVIMDKDVLSSQSVGGGEEGKWGEEIQQSLTDKAQCTPLLNSLCSDKVRVKKGKEI